MVSQKDKNELRKDAENKIDNFTEDEREKLLKKIAVLFASAVFVTKKYLGFTGNVEMSSSDRKVFSDIIADSIKGVSDDYKKELNTTLNIGMSEGDSRTELKKRIDNILQGDNPTKIKYQNRLNLILRTESSRIFNAGSFKTANKAGANYKYLIGTNDRRQGNDSKVALQKYGSPEKAIPIEDDFVFSEGGQEYRYKFPPNRPNDRETVIYLFEKP